MTLECVLEKLLEEAKDPKAGFDANIVIEGFAGGGAIRKTEWEGVWELMTFMPTPDGRGGQKLVPITYWFMGSQVKAIARARKEEESPIEMPSGLVIPGRNRH